jgi:hypothetical protein
LIEVILRRRCRVTFIHGAVVESDAAASDAQRTSSAFR